MTDGQGRFLAYLFLTSLCDPPLLRLLSGEHHQCLVFSEHVKDICLVAFFGPRQTFPNSLPLPLCSVDLKPGSVGPEL